MLVLSRWDEALRWEGLNVVAFDTKNQGWANTGEDYLYMESEDGQDWVVFWLPCFCREDWAEHEIAIEETRAEFREKVRASKKGARVRSDELHELVSFGLMGLTEIDPEPVLVRAPAEVMVEGYLWFLNEYAEELPSWWERKELKVEEPVPALSLEPGEALGDRFWVLSSREVVHYDIFEMVPSSDEFEGFGHMGVVLGMGSRTSVRGAGHRHYTGLVLPEDMPMGGYRIVWYTSDGRILRTYPFYVEESQFDEGHPDLDFSQMKPLV